jgi:hypothetical protein
MPRCASRTVAQAAYALYGAASRVPPPHAWSCGSRDAEHADGLHVAWERDVSCWLRSECAVGAGLHWHPDVSIRRHAEPVLQHRGLGAFHDGRRRIVAGSVLLAVSRPAIVSFQGSTEAEAQASMRAELRAVHGGDPICGTRLARPRGTRSKIDPRARDELPQGFSLPVPLAAYYKSAFDALPSNRERHGSSDWMDYTVRTRCLHDTEVSDGEGVVDPAGRAAEVNTVTLVPGLDFLNYSGGSQRALHHPGYWITRATAVQLALRAERTIVERGIPLHRSSAGYSAWRRAHVLVRAVRRFVRSESRGMAAVRGICAGGTGRSAGSDSPRRRRSCGVASRFVCEAAMDHTEFVIDYELNCMVSKAAATARDTEFVSRRIAFTVGLVWNSRCLNTLTRQELTRRSCSLPVSSTTD